MIVIVIAVLVDDYFFMQQVEIEILFQWVMYFIRMEYAIKLKLFRSDYLHSYSKIDK